MTAVLRAMPPGVVDEKPAVRPLPRPATLRIQLGVAGSAAASLEGYGPGSHLSEGDLLRGYGLLPPRRVEGR